MKYGSSKVVLIYKLNQLNFKSNPKSSTEIHDKINSINRQVVPLKQKKINLPKYRATPQASILNEVSAMKKIKRI